MFGFPPELRSDRSTELKVVGHVQQEQSPDTINVYTIFALKVRTGWLTAVVYKDDSRVALDVNTYLCCPGHRVLQVTLHLPSLPPSRQYPRFQPTSHQDSSAPLRSALLYAWWLLQEHSVNIHGIAEPRPNKTGSERRQLTDSGLDVIHVLLCTQRRLTHNALRLGSGWRPQERMLAGATGVNGQHVAARLGLIHPGDVVARAFFTNELSGRQIKTKNKNNVRCEKI